MLSNSLSQQRGQALPSGLWKDDWKSEKGLKNIISLGSFSSRASEFQAEYFSIEQLSFSNVCQIRMISIFCFQNGFVLEVILDWKIFKQMFQKKKKKSHVTKIYPSLKKTCILILLAWLPYSAIVLSGLDPLSEMLHPWMPKSAQDWPLQCSEGLSKRGICKRHGSCCHRSKTSLLQCLISTILKFALI